MICIKDEALNSFKVLGTDILVYENFINESELLLVESIINEFGSDLWRTEKYSHSFEAFNFIEEKIKGLLKDAYSIKDHSSIVKLHEGDVWGLHSDNHEFLDVRKLSLELKDDEEFELVDNNVFGIVVYLNSFEGGELEYPEQGVIYKPKAGDLVIHSSEDYCKHRVLEVKSSVRYSHSNAVYEKIKIPVKN